MISNKKIFPVYGLLIALAFTQFYSCSQKKEIKGSEYIPRDVLVDIIRDMHLMDGITNDMKYYRMFNPGDSIDMYSSIFEKYDVDREMYQRTVDEYSQYPELLNKVYDDVLMELNMMLDQLDEERDRKIEEMAREKEGPVIKDPVR